MRRLAVRAGYDVRMSDPMVETIEIRQESEGDAPAIRRVQEQAFSEEDEAKVVDMLRASDSMVLSLVAVVAGEVCRARAVLSGNRRILSC